MSARVGNVKNNDASLVEPFAKGWSGPEKSVGGPHLKPLSDCRLAQMCWQDAPLQLRNAVSVDAIGVIRQKLPRGVPAGLTRAHLLLAGLRLRAFKPAPPRVPSPLTDQVSQSLR
jgi:hypothetical protein